MAAGKAAGKAARKLRHAWVQAPGVQQFCRRELMPRIRGQADTRNALGCWTLSILPTKPNGYSQLMVKEQDQRTYGFPQKVLAHAAAYVAEHSPFDTKLDLSHRCHNRQCANPAHLVAEDPTANQRRKGCPGRLLLRLPTGPKQLKGNACFCSAQPPCLPVRTVDADADCEDYQPPAPPTSAPKRRHVLVVSDDDPDNDFV